jgi:Outer membrane receptor for ferrienterochelin and colicins
MKRLFGVLLLGTILHTASAQEITLDNDSIDFYTLSLEELMNIRVVSSTKTEMSMQKAPSVIRLFTKSDINEHGFQTIREVLDQVPGFEIQEYRAGHQLTWVRGVQSRYNNKVLLLIDGVPMRDSYYGNFNIDEMIPIETVERIEIINGPGSVLYGTNSFSGVVSITTKRTGKNVSVKAGSFNSYGVNAQADFKGLFVNGNVFKTDGFSPDLNSDGRVRKHDQSASNTSFLAKYEYKGLQLTGSYTHYEYPYRYRDSKSMYGFTRSPIYGAATYGFDINRNASLKFRAFYNKYDFEIEKTKFTNATSNEIKSLATEYLNSTMYGGDAEFFAKFTKHEFIGGISVLNDMANDMHVATVFPEREVEDMLVDGKRSFTRSAVGFFMQDTYNLSSVFALTTGLRYDVLSDFEDQLNYRLGLTASFTKNWYGKLLYGTAYRTPSYREYLDVVGYNNNLDPEHLKTLELQFGYVSNKIDINVTLYNNDYRDFINEVLVDSIQTYGGDMRVIDDEVSFNFDSRSITGVELNTVIKPNRKVSMLVGLSYKIRAVEEQGAFRTNDIIYTSQEMQFSEKDLLFMSKLTGNFTATYHFSDRVRLSLSGLYLSNRKSPADYQADVPEAAKNAGNADGFIRLNLAGSVNIYKGLSANVNVYNLFDGDHFSGPYGGQRDYDAQWTGRMIRTGLNYRF